MSSAAVYMGHAPKEAQSAIGAMKVGKVSFAISRPSLRTSTTMKVRTRKAKFKIKSLLVSMKVRADLVTIPNLPSVSKTQPLTLTGKRKSTELSRAK